MGKACIVVFIRWVVTYVESVQIILIIVSEYLMYCVVPYMNDLFTEGLDLHKATVLEDSCEHSIFYVNYVTEHDRRV